MNYKSKKYYLETYNMNSYSILIGSKKAEIEDPIEVKKWVDRILLKFAVRFAHFHRHDRNSFRLPQAMKHFPQFIYHLRRSTFINPFGYPPDQSIYVKACLMR